MTEETERTCATCACSILVKHLQLLNTNVMLCRRNPPFIITQQGPKGIEQGLTHSPTQAEMTCFDGWRPIGTLPGENAQTDFIKKSLNAIAGKFAANSVCTCTMPFDRKPGSHHSLMCPAYVASKPSPPDEVIDNMN